MKQTIIRDNCTEGTWCNNNACILSLPLDSDCWQDRECLSGTCSDDGKCINGPDVFHTIANWLWIILGCSVFVFVALILGVLWILHRYQSKKEHEKMAKFFGDNDEFYKKYQMMTTSTSNLVSLKEESDSRNASVVYLTTPDYNESAALTTKRSIRPTSTVLNNSSSIPDKLNHK